MKVSSRGQVAIPSGLRELMGVRPGGEVDVIADEGSLRMVRREPRTGPGTTPGQRTARRLRGTATAPLSTDELLGLARGE